MFFMLNYRIGNKIVRWLSVPEFMSMRLISHANMESTEPSLAKLPGVTCTSRPFCRYLPPVLCSSLVSSFRPLPADK